MKSLQGCSFEVFHGSITDRNRVLEAVEGCDYIIHAAANTAPSPNNYLHYLPVNVLGTRNLIEAAKSCHVKRLVFISTANTIGYGDSQFPGIEIKPIIAPFTQSGYAISKCEAERYILKAVNKDKLNAIILNPTFMIGPGDAKSSSSKILFNIINHRLVLLPNGGKNFIYVKDVATACCEALKKGKSGERYLLANENKSYKEFFELVSNLTDEKQSVIILPKRLVGFMGFFGSLLQILGIQFDLTHVNAKILGINNYYSGKIAEEIFDLKLTPINMAVIDALDWFVKNEYLKQPIPTYSI